jgi:hypothetical protein
MRLTGEQFLQLQSALLKAFPMRDTLRLMVRIRLQINLDEIIEGRNLTEAVSGLITWAEDRDQIEELLRKAHEHNPGNDTLRTVAESLPAALHAPPQGGDAREQIRNQKLDGLLNDFGIDLLVKGAKRVRSRAHRLFAEQVFPAHRLFGGRPIEWASLGQFVGILTSGYFFVTGPTGLGKTALLANFAHELETRKIGTALAFIAPDSSEKFCLESLCEQLLAFHELGGEIPAHESDLRILYADLLRLPPPLGKRIIVVLDGLEEALGQWTPRPTLFPQDLADGVQVIFSAGEVADHDDWPSKLGFSQTPELTFYLKALSVGEIHDVLTQLQHLADSSNQLKDGTAQKLHDLTQGDPFYLQEMLKRPAFGLDRVQSMPVGLDSYLRGWWGQASRGYEQAFADLMGILTVARAPLNRQELIDLSPQDAVKSSNFIVLVQQAARYIVGNEIKGYQLSHSRIRKFVLDHLSSDFQIYQNQMADYCQRWNQPGVSPVARDYMFLYAVPHLAEAGRWPELLNLLSPEWIQAKWERFGSYSAFLTDLDTATIAALQQNPPDYASLAALVTAGQTAREIMLNLPTTLLRAWVRVGKVEPVVALLKASGTVKARAAEPMIAVATELLASFKEDKLSTAKADYPKIAADLLSGALGMLPLIRTSSWQLQRLTETRPLILADGLDDTLRLPLLEQASKFARGIEEPSQRAACLGFVAGLLASSSDGVDSTSQLVGEARQAMARLTFGPDRLVALTYLLPALRLLQPEKIFDEVRSTIQSVNDPFKSSSLAKSPLRDLLVDWVEGLSSRDERVIQFLKELGNNCVSTLQPDTRGYTTPEGIAAHYIAELLGQLGNVDDAFDMIESMWARSPMQATDAILLQVSRLYAADANRIRSWLDQAKDFADDSFYELPINRELYRSRLSRGLAEINRWDEAFNVLATISNPGARVDTIQACLRIAGESLAGDQFRLENITNQLIKLSMAGDGQEQASVLASASLALLPYNAATAAEYIRQAAEISLADLPEGDTDYLRCLLAIALHQERHYDEAVITIQGMKSQQNIVQVCNRLIDITLQTEDQVLAKYVELVVNATRAAEKDVLLTTVLQQSIHTVKLLVDKLPDQAKSLCDVVRELCRFVNPDQLVIQCLALQAAARIQFDRIGSIEDFNSLIDLLEQWLAPGVDNSSFMVESVYRSLADIAGLFQTETRLLLERLRPLTLYFNLVEDRIRLECAYTLPLAQIEPDVALEILHRMLEHLVELGQNQADALYISRMIADLTNDKVGPRREQAEASRWIVTAAFNLPESHYPSVAELLNELLNVILSIDSPNDQAQSLAYFLEACAKAPQKARPTLHDVCNAALEKVSKIPDPGLSAYVLQKAVKAFCWAGDFSTAEGAIALISDAGARDSAQFAIDSAHESEQIGELSALDKAFVEVLDPGLRYAVLHTIHVDQDASGMMDYLGEELANQRLPGERSGLLNGWVPSMLMPAWAIGGASAMTAYIEKIEDFDQRFIQAAALIAA